MFKIERRDELKEPVYTIGSEEYVTKDMVRLKCKKIEFELKQYIKNASDELRDSPPEDAPEKLYDKAGELIALCVNIAMGLKGDEAVSTEAIDSNLTNADMVEFAVQFCKDNQLTPVVNFFKELLLPFWEGTKQKIAGQVFQSAVEMMLTDETPKT